jgi:putative membrane protein
MQTMSASSWAALPPLNALLNASSALLLITGYGFIRKHRVSAHRACMLSAFICSTLFLISYVTYHAHAGTVHFNRHGLIRTVYFTILTSHTLLAALIVPLVLRTLYLAFQNRFEAHKRLARWTLPLWLYVSVTGVLIYEMLY